jgi:hypothetical protein
MIAENNDKCCQVLMLLIGEDFSPRRRKTICSLPVDADSYLLQLVRYIHRNPLRAGLTDKMDSYGWSSHKGYLSKAKKWDWLHKEYILRNDTLKQICEQFEMTKYSSVSSVIERMKASVAKERKLRKRVDKLVSQLMSQEQTLPLFFGSLCLFPSFQ